MSFEFFLTPGASLRIQNGSGGDANVSYRNDAWFERVSDAFALSQAEGLFALAATKPSSPLPPSVAYWQDFASLYLTELCRTPESEGARLDPIEPPTSSERNDLFLSAPPMRGGEYLSPDSFVDLWNDLDGWVREEIVRHKESLNSWLAKNAPLWHQVGRVCFHLAENKRDPELPFAFLATYAPKLSQKGRVQYQPLGKALQEYAGDRNKKALIKLLTPVQRAADQVEFVRELVESGDVFHPLAWTPGEAYQLLKNSPRLEESGLLVRLPDWWKKRPRPQVSVTIGEKKKGLFGMDTLLDFKVDLTFDGQKLTEQQWREIMASDNGLAYIKGQWIEVDKEKLNEALAHWRQVEADAGGNGISFIEGMRLLAGAQADLSTADSAQIAEQEWAFVDAGNWLSGMLAGLRNPDGLVTAGENKHFHGILRPYQAVGRDWLYLLSTIGLGACLADDMGLGKTVQIISLLVALKEKAGATNKPSLLVLPASLLANWKAELKRFAPSLRTRFVHPSETDQSTLATMAKAPDQAFPACDIVLTSYGMLRRQPWLLDLEWQLVILDEAQAVKNPGSRQTKAVKQLKANSRIALSGTPIENRLSDLWSLFDFLCPGLLGTVGKFKQFVKGLEKREHDQYAPLRKLVAPYILRRLKTDKSIITDLPDKTEIKAYCGLTKKQAALYAKSVESLAESLEELDGMQRRGLVLAFLMRFKQICNHPSQFLGDGEYADKDSGKIARLKSICEEIASRQEKVLVFTQFREMTEPLALALAGTFGREGIILHGGTPVKQRQKLVKAFQQDEGPPFFILSLKAGGTGLNLTAASHVIHFDRWWNPAVENQATDRAFRIGQHRNVVVHKFICRGTIEEKIDSLLEEKAGMAEDIFKDGAQSLLTEMSNDELLSAVALNIDQAQF
ncbi:MAG: DEAD/DEAH box helicase [Verrucomicrobia bacterium]|nr:DEAD/DEAH box helicase [Verrucomicrobiota bacterium]MDA1067747.1 DEAD/DEAH box helicase [Verrucomicrobiota bacterium]